MSFSVRTLKDQPPKKKRTIRWERFAVIGITLARPLLGWYHSWKQRQEEEQRSLMLKRVLLILVAVLCVFLLLAGTAKALLGLKNVGLNTFVAVTGAELPHDENGFTNLLLLGQGDAGHDGVDLTDTIMVVSVDPHDTKSVVALSLPRDLYFLHTENMGVGRVNSLYRDYKSYLRAQGTDVKEASQEAMKQLQAEIGNALGIEVHGTVKADFRGFVEVVDVIGGIDVEVPEDIVDTEYPDENYGYQTFSISAGLRHLDGETALKYARSRHTSSDFDRSARQQQILVAIAEKAKAEKLHRDVGAITDLFRILSEQVETTLSIREIIALAGLGDEIDRSRVVTMQLSDRNGLYGGFAEPGGLLYSPPREQFSGASVLLPVSIPEFPVTWAQVQTLGDLLFDMRAIYLAKPTIALLNAGGPSGAARVLATELIRYGFDVQHIANAENLPDQERSWITSLAAPPSSAGNSEKMNTANAAIAEFFSSLLGIPVSAAPTGSLTAEEMQTVTIVLGEDYQYRSLKELIPEGN